MYLCLEFPQMPFSMCFAQKLAADRAGGYATQITDGLSFPSFCVLILTLITLQHIFIVGGRVSLSFEQAWTIS